MTERPVTLGFVEPPEYEYRSSDFPSKVGGEPVWLCLDQPPPVDGVTCGICGDVSAFLLQVACPLEQHERCYHRALFVFCCLRGECHREQHGSGAYSVMRCQLPRQNPFYSDEDSDAADGRANTDVEDELLSSLRAQLPLARPLLPVYEIVDEDEPEIEPDNDDNDSDDDGDDVVDVPVPAGEVMDPRFREAILKDATLACNEGDARDMGELMEEAAIEEDKVYNRFMKHVKAEPEQILRYQRGGECLWVADASNLPPVPRCEACGSERVFEMQVMPQLLNHLGLETTTESPDWGTLAIFTCKDNCSTAKYQGYRREYVMRQMFQESKLKGKLEGVVS